MQPAPEAASGEETSFAAILRRLRRGIVVETRSLLRDSATTHRVELDESGTVVRVACEAVPAEDIANLTRYGVPTCPRCVSIDAQPVACLKESPRYLGLELRRVLAEPVKNALDAREAREEGERPLRAAAEAAGAAAAEEERLRLKRQRDEERQAGYRAKRKAKQDAERLCDEQPFWDASDKHLERARELCRVLEPDNEPIKIWLLRAEQALAEQERDALKREKERDRRVEATRRAWVAAERAKRCAWEADQHVTLSPREQTWERCLRENWAAHGAPPIGSARKTDAGVPSGSELVWAAEGDCGRRHRSGSAARACANVRMEDAEKRDHEHARKTPAPQSSRALTSPRPMASSARAMSAAPESGPRARVGPPAASGDRVGPMTTSPPSRPAQAATRPAGPPGTNQLLSKPETRPALATATYQPSRAAALAIPSYLGQLHSIPRPPAPRTGPTARVPDVRVALLRSAEVRVAPQNAEVCGRPHDAEDRVPPFKRAEAPRDPVARERARVRLLRAGAWPRALLGRDIIPALGDRDELPAGAADAIVELVGSATPDASKLGRELRWVADQPPVDGIKLTARRDRDHFTWWQVARCT